MSHAKGADGAKRAMLARRRSEALAEVRYATDEMREAIKAGNMQRAATMARRAARVDPSVLPEKERTWVLRVREELG
jgi:hypothetical protein